LNDDGTNREKVTNSGPSYPSLQMSWSANTRSV
jgi:hypothetical protein